MNEDFVPYGVDDVILTIRGQKVILDSHLAALYGVATKALNQAVRRDSEKFPPEFASVLTAQEIRELRRQASAASSQQSDSKRDTANWSQIVTSSQKHRGGVYVPTAFTEHGAIMVATVLNSPKAVEMSVFIVKAFVRMRQALLSRSDLERRLDQIEKILLVHDDGLRDLYDKIRPLLLPASEPERKPIGFRVRERRASYRTGSGIRQ